MEKFKYDIYTLIEAVENKQCLWDKSNEHYKDKIMRKTAWRFVCSILEPEFENFEIKSQEEIITIVMNKWTHIRDSFMRSMNSKSGQESKRKYVYAEYMQFLLKNMTADDTESSIQSGPSTRDEDSDIEETNTSTSHKGDIQKPNSKRKKMNTIDKEILNSIRSSSPAIKEDTLDEDKAFLMSLLPTLKKISDDDKIDFRIEMMQLFNKYLKRNRNTFNKFSYQVPSPMTRESPSPQSLSSHFDSQYLASPSPHQSSMQNEFHTSYQLSSPHQSPAPNKPPSQSTTSYQLSSLHQSPAPNKPPNQSTTSYQLSSPHQSPAPNKPPSQSTTSYQLSSLHQSPAPNKPPNQSTTSYQLSSPHQSPAPNKPPSQSTITILSSQTVRTPNPSQVPNSYELETSSVPSANNEQPAWVQILERSRIENYTEEAKTAADLIQNYKFD